MSKSPHKFKVHRRIVSLLRKRIRKQFPTAVQHSNMLFSLGDIKPLRRGIEVRVTGELVDAVDSLGYFDFNGNWHWDKSIKNIHNSHTSAIKLAIADMHEAYSEVGRFVSDITIKPSDRRRSKGKWSF